MSSFSAVCRSTDITLRCAVGVVAVSVQFQRGMRIRTSLNGVGKLYKPDQCDRNATVCSGSQHRSAAERKESKSGTLYSFRYLTKENKKAKHFPKLMYVRLARYRQKFVTLF